MLSKRVRSFHAELLVDDAVKPRSYLDSRLVQGAQGLRPQHYRPHHVDVQRRLAVRYRAGHQKGVGREPMTIPLADILGIDMEEPA